MSKIIQHKKIFKPLLSALGLICIFGFAFEVKAQLDTSPSIPSEIPEIQEQVYVDQAPGNPNPGDTVKISLEAYGTDLNSANVTWKINGTVAKEGRGIAELDVVAGDSGTKKTVDVYIDPPNGPEIQKTVVIEPEQLDIVWEAKAYTPPFYKGKALYAPQEKVVIAAFPNFEADGSVGVDPSHISYSWTNNLDAVPQYSGYGSNYMLFQGPIVQDDQYIYVTATADSGASAEANIDMLPTLPNVLVYEDNPLYGVLFNKALPANFSLQDSQTTLAAYPYYFGFTSQTDPNAEYQWTINGQNISASQSQATMVFTNSSGQSGSSEVGIDVQNANNFLEEATQNLNINFNATSNQQNTGVSF